jgi:hypothetical protein
MKTWICKGITTLRIQPDDQQEILIAGEDSTPSEPRHPSFSTASYRGQPAYL